MQKIDKLVEHWYKTIKVLKEADSENILSWSSIPEIPVSEIGWSDMTTNEKGEEVTGEGNMYDHFRELYRIWDSMRKSESIGVARIDYSDPFIEYREMYVEEFTSLSPIAKAWSSIEFLRGIGEVEFITRLLPRALMDKKIRSQYLADWEDSLQSFTGLEKIYRETGEFRTDYAERPEFFGGYHKVDSDLRMIAQEDIKNHNKVDKSVGLCG